MVRRRGCVPGAVVVPVEPVPVLRRQAAHVRRRPRRRGRPPARLELTVLRVDGKLAAYVLGVAQGRAYAVLEGRFAGQWAR